MNNFIEKIIIFTKNFLEDLFCLKKWEDDSRYHDYLRSDDQLSVRVLGFRKNDSYVYKGDSFMFIQDMYSGIMPFMHYNGKKEAYPTKLDPESEEIEKMITDGISDRGSVYFIEDALCDFVRKTGHLLYNDGIVFYEIITDKDENDKVESFNLELIRSKYFFYFLGNYYQIIPWWEAKKARVKVQIIKVPKDKVLKIEIPKQLGGGRRLRKAMKRLWKLSRDIIPKFQMDILEENKDIGFNMEEFNKARYLEVAKLTKNFGWNQRERSSASLSEYYLILRHLRYKKTEALIREEVISKLNSALNGPFLNLNVKISMENLFTVEDVNRQEKILSEGNVKFVDIINAIKI